MNKVLKGLGPKQTGTSASSLLFFKKIVEVCYISTALLPALFLHLYVPHTLATSFSFDVSMMSLSSHEGPWVSLKYSSSVFFSICGHCLRITKICQLCTVLLTIIVEGKAAT